MSTEETYWFHCGHCGMLHQSVVDHSTERVCPHCGMNPVPLPADAQQGEESADGEVGNVTLSPPKLVRSRRVAKSGLIWKVLLAWMITMIVIYLLGQWLWGDEKEAVAKKVRQASVEPGRPATADEDAQLLKLALPECEKVLIRFLSTDRVAARLPLVRYHPEIAERMTSYYKDNSLLTTNPEALKMTERSIFHLPDGEAVILTMWETQEGASFDAAFRLDRGGWVLDWEHFVRFSDLSWPLFLAGSGEADEAEFRLLARQRMISKDDPEDGIGVVLYAPMRRHLAEPGYQAPMMGLSGDDLPGRLLKAGFKKMERQEPIFGAGFMDINPQGMIRVRVRVERISGDGGYKYRITEVGACHWYSSDATGIVLEEEPEETEDLIYDDSDL